MILQVTVYLLIGLLSSLRVGRALLDPCEAPLSDIAVFEGTLSTQIYLPGRLEDVRLSIVPTTANNNVDIIIVPGHEAVHPNYAADFAFNSSVLTIKNATTTAEPGHLLSTAGQYRVWCGGYGGIQPLFKFLVVRQGPMGSIRTLNATMIEVICSSIYADNNYDPIAATFTLYVDGNLMATDTPERTSDDGYHIFISTSVFTTVYSNSFIYQCGLTFGNTTFNHNFSIAAPAFSISMKPLFGPVAGGTNITITGPSPSDYPPSNSQSYIPDLGDAINVYIGNYLQATSVFKVNVSSTVSLVAVTPNTTEASIGQPLPVIIEFSSAPVKTILFNMTFNKIFTYLPNPNITSLYPNHFIVNGGTLLDVTGHSMSSVYKPIIQLTVIIYRANENGSTLAKSTTATFGVCRVRPGNDTYMQCQMPPLNLSDDLLAILNSGYNTDTIRIKRQIQPSVLTVNGQNGTDSAEIRLGFILDGYKEYENINDALPDTKFIFYSPPEINSTDELIEFDPSVDEFIYVKGRCMLRGCLQRDYVVHIGNQTCTISDLHDNQLSFRPPKAKPDIPMNDIYCHQHLSIAITVGYKHYQYACFTYKDTKNIALIVGLTAGLVGFAILLSILIVCIVRCRSKKVIQETQSNQHSGGPELRHRHEQPESQQNVNIIYRIQNRMTLYRPDDYYENGLPLELQPGYDHRIEEYGDEVKANDEYLTSSDVGCN